MSILTELNGQLAILGGISGAAVLLYFSLMIYYAREKDRHVTELKIELARIEGLLLGRRKR
jgi:hypothetical protein